MRIEADHDRCTGTANCVGIAPDIFDIDNHDRVRILLVEVPEHMRTAAEAAVQLCPMQALRIV